MRGPLLLPGILILAATFAAAAEPDAGAVPPVPGAADQAVLRALDDCRARLDPQVDVGYERIVARCPGLPRLLRESAIASWLPRSWQDTGNNLSAGSLEELRVLAARELTARAGRPVPDVRRLDPVLGEIGQSATRRDGLWDRFRAWLRRVVADQHSPADTGALSHMISRLGITRTVIEIITYGALAIVMALAALIVVNELRAAGVLRRRRVQSSRGAAQVGGSSRDAHEASVDLERIPLYERPRVLLELLLDWMVRVRGISTARSLTARELTQALPLKDSEDAARLRQLAMAAEQIRFSPQTTAPQRVNDAVNSGRELLDRLDAGAAR